MSRSLALKTVAGGVLALMLGACSSEPAALVSSRSLAAASASMVEGDLPGCDAVRPLSTGLGAWEVLRHPYHPDLVVVTRNSAGVCIDTLDHAVSELQRAGISASPLEATQEITVGDPTEQAATPHDDDPVPILRPASPDQAENDGSDRLAGTSSPDGPSGGVSPVAMATPRMTIAQSTQSEK